MIQRIFKNILVLIILTAVVVGSSGINILIHNCSGSKSTDYISYPELHKTSPGSCCPVNVKTITEKPDKQAHIKKTACCKLNKITLKVNPFERQFTTQASVLLSPELLLNPIHSNVIPADDTNIIACNSPPLKTPEKLSGKELVYFIQQLRIPASC